jgi:Leucine-rich repeat (LRR) protein
MVENHVRLAGPLPQTMGNMTSLYSVALLFNGPNFGGELPSGLFQLKNVHTIHIQHDFGKQWSLPANVQVHVDTQLERLLLIESSFTGNIPSWIAQLSQLQTLDLSGNTFQGASLEAIGNLSSLKYLNLRENNFTETIPSSFGQLTNLEALILGKNKLHGVLPASIGNLRALKIIDVGSNDLTSVIPSSFANLESLSKFRNDHNMPTLNVDLTLPVNMSHFSYLFIRIPRTRIK